MSRLIEWCLDWCSHLGIACKLSGQDPVLNKEVVPSVAVANDDEDGEDAAGPTVEAHVKLTKTIGG